MQMRQLLWKVKRRGIFARIRASVVKGSVCWTRFGAGSFGNVFRVPGDMCQRIPRCVSHDSARASKSVDGLWCNPFGVWTIDYTPARVHEPCSFAYVFFCETFIGEKKINWFWRHGSDFSDVNQKLLRGIKLNWKFYRWRLWNMIFLEKRITVDRGVDLLRCTRCFVMKNGLPVVFTIRRTKLT